MNRHAPARSPRFGEREAVALFRARLGSAKPGVRLGIGDDAALLVAPRAPLVLTVDACVEGTHFLRSLIELRDVGYKAFQAAASDLAAMGARPLAALSALELPRGFSKRELDSLARGQAEAARELACPVVGGNVARAARLSITTTVIGEARRPLTRAGARAGDELWLVGELGLAALGLRLLRSRRAPPARFRRERDVAVRAWRRPQALLSRGLGLVGRAHAAIDVSDGLAGDVLHLAEASGVRAVLYAALLERALSSELRALASFAGRTPLELALAGGEDYALVAAGPPP
ncbi:MAG TPA: thiamine-phosphate kinase, partial [Polyangiaceae bacterium]